MDILLIILAILIILGGIIYVTYIYTNNKYQDITLRIEEVEELIDDTIKAKYNTINQVISQIHKIDEDIKGNIFDEIVKLRSRKISNYELDKKIIVDSNCNDNELLAIFKENKSNQEELDYFIITEIDKLNADIQNKYYQIVKDREFFGVELPEDMVIVLTVNDKEGLKNISRELYNLCVVAF